MHLSKMAKKENKTKAPVVKAPTVEAPAKEKTPTKVDVIQVGDMEKIKKSYAQNGGLDPNHRVDVLMGIKTYFKDDPNAAKNTGIPQEAIDKINGIAAIGFVAALGDEILMGTSGWSAKMRMTQIEAINSVNALTGISVDTKALPAPDAEGNVEVKKENIKVDAETKKALKKEKDINAAAEKKDYLENHTLIKTEDQLKEALEFQLVNAKIARPIERLVTAAQFYRAYLEAHAESANDPQAELAKIHGYTLANLLQDISTMVPPTFTASGFGKYLCLCAANANNIIPAFNMFKRACVDRKTGKVMFSDSEIAAMVRVLIVWNCSAQIARVGSDLKILSENAEANAKAISECNEKIAYLQGVMALTSNPSFDVADNFIAAYKNEDNELHKMAKDIFVSSIDTYYKGVEIPELEIDTALLNIQQHAGITLNLFTDELLQRTEYSEDNIVALSTETEEKPAEETKNS